MEIFVLAAFLVGYFAIIFEHRLVVNKAATALCMGVICWVILSTFTAGATESILHDLEGQLSEISSILIFLIGAMTIVEMIDAHNGFHSITERIKTKDKRKLLWTISILTFFLSSALDNLTATIVILSLLGKIIGRREDRLMFAIMVIVSANAGGAWTPIGDVTTTMLWIKGQIGAVAVITQLFIPSLVAMLVPLTALTFMMKGKVKPPVHTEHHTEHLLPKSLRNSVLFVGVGSLLMVPVFKTITHLPPYMGVALGLGILWVYTEVVYRKYSKSFKGRFSVTRALSRVDMGTIAFFLGILLAVGALQTSGILGDLAEWLDRSTNGNHSIMVLCIGIASAVVDNVPLVAAIQNMYSFPTNDFFWILLAYAAGTGGSILIIGSAAGVAAMGMEKIDFIWYLKRASGWVLLGYFAGAAVYIGIHYLLM